MSYASVLKQIEDAYSASTMRAYRADFAEFDSFCSQCNETSLPANINAVATFIDRVSQNNITSATIRRKLVSIAAVHRWAGYPDPTKEPMAKLAIRKMHRKLGRHHDQAMGLSRTDVERMQLATTDDLRGLRNRVLLWLAYDTMRRRSELSSLMVEDLRLRDDGGDILLRRSKTDQEGRGIRVFFKAHTAILLREWLQKADITHGALLRGISGNNQLGTQLTGGQIGRIFKKLAGKTGLPNSVVRHISGHSMRVGAAQDMVRAGATLPQIMLKGGWTKVDTVMRYLEQAGQTAS